MSLTFEKQFLIASHLLALVGVLALTTTHEVSAPYVGVAVLGLSWSLLREWRRRGPQISARAANVAMFAALFVVLSPVALRGASPVRPIAEFLLVLGGLKCAAAKENRDWLQIYTLSFFHLLAASALTVEPIFAVLFLAYLVLAPCVLVLLLLRREMAGSPSARRLEEEPFVEPSLFRSIAATTVVLFVSTLLIFIIFPRVGAGYLAAPFSGGQVLAGFSEEVGLGNLSALKQDDTVALRVAVDRPELFGATRWRGAALDHFDGREWRRRPQEQRPFMRPEAGLFTSSERVPPVTLVREEVVLEPQDTSALFVAGRPIEIRGRFGEVAIDGIGNLRVIRPTGVRIRYQVMASLAPRRTPPSAETLALPPIDPRIVELAREQVKGVGSASARADALLGYFRHGFRYTLEPGDSGGEDPLVRFLFETRSGFCEHFASAYAVMLRAVGIPSLVVTGYAGGEWNPYGNYFVIRQSDAHSWVEAYVDGAWRTDDPTPPGAPHAVNLGRRIAAAIDALEMRWYRYVINYTLEDQAEAALSLRDASRRMWERLSQDWWSSLTSRGDERGADPSARRTPYALVAVGILVLVFVGWFWRSKRTAATLREAALSAATRCYVRLLGALAARGLEKRPGETPLEFCRRVAPRLDGQAEGVARVTALYQQARFSGRDLAPGELDREIESVIAALAATTDSSRARAD
jgi:transglutaminase-like putative cysteine protease